MTSRLARTSLASSGCWPDTRQDLLLSAALAEPSEAIDAWRAWRAQASIDDIDQASFRLLPLVYLTLAPLGALGDEEPRLRGVYRQNWARNQRRVHLAATALTAMNAARIPTLCLKGLVLGQRYYRNIGARSMADIDIVTRNADVARALEVLEASGWRLRHLPFDRERRRGASTPLLNAAGDELDLHWHLLYVRPLDDVDATFWEGAEVVEVGGVPTRALRPADELLHAFVHGLHWNPVNSLRWIADAVVLLRAVPDIEWDRLFDRARHLDLSRPASVALAYLHERFPALVPTQVAERAAGLTCGLGDRVEWWVRMRGPAMPPGPFGYVIRYWRQFRRLRHAGDSAVASGFASYIADALRVDGARPLARAIARRAFRRG